MTLRRGRWLVGARTLNAGVRAARRHKASFRFEFLDRAGAERERLSAAREASLGRERPAVDSPHVRLDGDVGRARVVDVEAACLALPVRARLAEPGCD